MEKEKKYSVTRGGGAKKYFITFAAALAAAAVVIAIFALVTNSTKPNWLRTNNGAARETLFPYVFTSGNSLYVLDEKLKTHEIDDNVSNSVHDVDLNRVYYTRDGALYEYRVEKDTRKKLCEGVESFVLLKERRSIFFENTSGEICIYDYNDEKVTVLRRSVYDEAAKIPMPISSDDYWDYGAEFLGGANSYLPYNIGVIAGESRIAYIDGLDSETKTADLYLAEESGETSCIAKDIDVSGSIYIWENESCISYYKDGALVLADFEGLPKEYFDRGAVVVSKDCEEAVAPCTVTDVYGETVSAKYIVSEHNVETGTAKLSYVRIIGKTITVNEVCGDVTGIVDYSPEDELVIYTVKDGDGLKICSSRKGKDIRQNGSCGVNDIVCFNKISRCIYINDENGTLTMVDVDDKKNKVLLVAEGVLDVTPYCNKPYAVFSLKDSDEMGVVIKKNRIERFSDNEIRLYGNSDDKYIMCRSLGDMKYSLDYVWEDSITRISGDAKSDLVFDKSIENVIYLENGELFLWTHGDKISLGEFPEGFETVKIITEKD